MLEDVVPFGDVRAVSAIDARVGGLELRVVERVGFRLLMPLIRLIDLHLRAVALWIEPE